MINTCTEMPVEMRSRAAVEKHKLWRTGTTLHVRFIGGEAWMRATAVAAAAEWMRCANIKFVFDDHPSAQIKISFDQQQGHWSMVGRDAIQIAQMLPTMNLAFVAGHDHSEYHRVALHEFGHALGLIHEHQNPVESIAWNVEAVFAHYGQTQGWDRAMTQRNILDRYSVDAIQGTAVDRLSIMMYPIPAELTLNGFTTGWNVGLSRNDIAFIGRIYPYIGQVSPYVAPVNLRAGGKARTLTRVNVRRSPGYVRKPASDVVTVLRAGQVISLLAGHTTKDGLRWWGVDGGYMAQNTPSGVTILEAA